MDCPRCRISTVGSRCPNCGADLAPSASQQPTPVPPQREGGWTGSASAVREEDLREQIRSRRLERGQRVRRSHPRGQSRKGKPAAQPPESAKRPLFDYKLPRKTEVESSRRKVVSFTGQARPPVATEKPLIRRPVRPTGAPRSQSPKQGVLTLEAPLPSVRPPSEKCKAHPYEAGISHEILLSRLLAGMIDLMLPVVTGGAFGLLGATLLGTDFFAEGSLRLSLLLALGFFFFNSFYFLLLSGQTPGMYWTDLELVGDDSRAVPFLSLVIRIFLFLPVAVSVVGLLSSVFDPRCRCLHDRFSRTRIIPNTFAGSS